MATELRLARGFALPLDIVTEAIGIVATRGAGKSYASAVLLEETHGAGVPFVVLDPSGVYHGLRSSADGEKPGLPIYVLGGPHGDIPLEDGAGRLIADLVVDSGHSFVLDLSDFTKTKMRRFVAEFLERLYDRKARSRTTLLLVIDEADEFAPQKPRGDTILSLAAMETIAKRGRARGLGLVLITQRTQALNKDVLDLIETLLAMRQLAERSREAVKGWIADKDLRDDAGIIESLQALPTGTAWVWSPLRGILEKVAIRRIRTFDSYATPKPGEAKLEPRRRADLDLEALGEQMRATIERAKENDPAELRRRLRDAEKRAARADDLEAELHELEAEVLELRARPEAKIVEKPIAVMEDLDKVWAAIHEAKQVAESLPAAINTVAKPLAAAILAATETHEKTAQAARQPAAQPLPAPPRPLARPAPAAAQNGSHEPADGFRISRPQQAILDTIRWFEDLGVPHPSRTALGFMAKVSPKSSGFEKNLSTLRTAGLISYPAGGVVGLTDEGHAHAAASSLPATDEALQDAIYAAVGPTKAAILRVLVESYPDDLDREELANRAGASATSSGFEKNLSTLRTLGLLDYPARGYVVAARLLFPVSERV